MSIISKPISILAIDTSTEVCSVALACAGVIHDKTVLAAREHTQRVLPMVESLLAESKLSLKDLDAIAVSSGPGSFTGLRIGLSIAQGLAYGADLPLIPISSLMAMAHSVARQWQDKGIKGQDIIVPAIDARMNEIYWSTYQLDKANTVNALSKECVSVPEACYEHCQQFEANNVIAVGSGWRYADATAPSVAPGVIDAQFYASAYDIAELAIVALEQGKTIDPLQAQPTYLRNEISWQKRQRIRS